MHPWNRGHWLSVYTFCLNQATQRFLTVSLRKRVRRGDRARRILAELRLKDGIVERRAERLDVLPDCVIQEGSAARDTLMQLCRNESWLRLEVVSVVFPRCQ